MRRVTALLICIAPFMVVTSGIHAQSLPQCTKSTDNDWLTRGDRIDQSTRMAEGRVWPVTRNLGQAIAQLGTRSAKRLTDIEVQQFIGGDVTTQSDGLHPYLVRAVFPVANPTLDVLWNGKNLGVGAFGLGCAVFVKHPIIVLLEDEPENVFVSAAAAL